MLLYTNGHDDYGKREMTLRRTLRYIKNELFESISKEDLINTLLLIKTGECDCDLIPKISTVLDHDVEYTGNDPIHSVIEILDIFPRQVFIMVEFFRQRFYRYGGCSLDAESNITIYHYLLNKKVMMMDLPYTLTLQEINFILGAETIEFEFDDDIDD